MIFAHYLFQPGSNTPTDVSALEGSISALERAISALESEVKALETRSVPWEHWVWVFTFLVVVGVALEWWIIRHEWHDEMRAWALGHFGVVRLAGRPSLLKLYIEIASVSLIALGVAGELGIGIEISSINGRLRGKSAELRSKNADLRSQSDQLLALVTLQAGDAKDSALIAKASARTAGVEADKAQTKADAVAEQANGLDRDLAAAKTQLAAVDAKRAELEKTFRNLAVCSAPRVLPVISSGTKTTGIKSTVDPLRKFALYNAVIEFIPNDAEARRAAFSVRTSLLSAGWKVPSLAPVEGIRDGVSVEPFEGPEDGSMLGHKWASYDAADTLVDFLHSFNWQARWDFLEGVNGALIHDPRVVPPPGVRIRIGLYPAVPVVVPKGAESFSEAIVQYDKENEKRAKERAEQRRKRLETLPPEEAKRRKALMEEEDRQTELWMERTVGPCRDSLSPSFLP